jgi:ankyrin repeat protein
MLLEDYEQVIIPSTVMMELSYRKTQKNTPEERKTAKVAWQVMANIDYYMVEYGEGKEESNGKEDDESDEVSNDNGESKKKNKEKARIIKIDNDKYKVPDSIPNVRNMINDHKVMAMAKDLEKKVVGDVIIIHDDVDFADYDGKGKAVRIDDYIAKRSRLIDYNSITDLDMEFDHLEEFKRIIKSLDLNAYMADGMTLLISAIRCNDIEKIKERNGRRIPDPKVSRKVRFLIDSGVDLNKNDNGRYCLPPLSHCIQIDNFDIFNMLLEEGCDFNKASRDETTASYMKVGKLNEGNTPLMIACYHARKKYVYKLCEKEGISLNQQDSNGYTALIKCAVQRYNRIKRGQKVSANEELYNYLISKGADTLIRDRNNHTAKDWFKRGDDMSYKENEQW